MHESIIKALAHNVLQVLALMLPKDDDIIYKLIPKL